jgi:hypothetical protein
MKIVSTPSAGEMDIQSLLISKSRKEMMGIIVAFGVEFEVRDFVRTGIPLTVIAYVLVLVFGASYWKWLGYV